MCETVFERRIFCLVTYPEIILALEVDLGSSRDGGALVGPGSGDARSSVDGDLATGRETEVLSIVTTNQGGVVSVVADTAAGHRQIVAGHRGHGRDERGQNRETHIVGGKRMADECT
jgi:hypothetical protein